MNDILLPGQWTPEKAHDWYNQQPYMYGANFLPSDAVNQIEMWQDDTFNPELIATELGYMQKAGMNVARVFLHDMVWQQDPAGFKNKIDTYLDIADQCQIRTLLVNFDSVWNPYPHLGPQPEAKPFVHNSGWVQGPGIDALSDPSQYGRLREYVADVTTTFGHDKRVLGWDIWNEPDNLNNGSYNENDRKWSYVAPLLADSFKIARQSKPEQFLTSGVWIGDWDRTENLHPIFKIQLEQSDIVSFHNYGDPQDFIQRGKMLQDTYQRPVICTEYMARPLNSTFDTILPAALSYNIATFNWGCVAGKSYTQCPWTSWGDEKPAEPDIWFHDIFRQDGSYYLDSEKQFFENFKQQASQKTGKRPLMSA